MDKKFSNNNKDNYIGNDCVGDDEYIYRIQNDDVHNVIEWWELFYMYDEIGSKNQHLQ